MPKPIFKIPCSMIHKIMGEPKRKGEILSESAKSYCETWVLNKMYEKTNIGFAWQSEKGLAVEQQAIEYVNEKYFPNEKLVKNEKLYENYWITGIPDAITSCGSVFDIKCPWSHTSFPILHKSITNIEYYWQLQGYMDVVDDVECNSAALIYVLMDAPEHIIIAQAKKMHLEMDGKKSLDELIEDYRRLLTYKNIHDSLKIHYQPTAKNNSDIRKIHSKVMDCRKYIDALTSHIDWE